MGSRETNVIDCAAAVAGRILCDGAFVFADPLPAESTPDIGGWEAIGVELTFAGAESGAVSVWAGRRFISRVAANMLGADEGGERAREEGVDALGELLNMIVGNLLTELYGTEPLFNLGLPREAKRNRLASDLSERECIWFEAEGEPVLFTVQL